MQEFTGQDRLESIDETFVLNPTDRTTDKVSLWDYFVVMMFLITSGATFWVGLLTAGITFSIFFVVALINCLCVKKGINNIFNPSVNFIYLVIILCLINFIIYQPEYKDNSMIGYLICIISAYLVISQYDFYYFRRILTNVVFVISAVGIPIFLLFEYDILPTQEISVQSGKDYTMFYIYTLGWPYPFGRFTGIWHEAGACQIILNSVLWLHFNNMINWEWEKGQLIKLLIILIASLLTMSTGGYLVLMLLFLSVVINLKSVVINLKIERKHKIPIVIIVFAITVLSLVLMISSDVVQNKLFDAEGEHVSKMERISDVSALWQMTLERPLLGYGIGTVEFWNMSDKYGNTSCSTGLLTYSASLGFTWMFIFILFLWKGIRQMGLGKASFLLLIAVLLMQFNEKFIEYPITNLFIFRFASYYDKINKETIEDKCCDCDV